MESQNHATAPVPAPSRAELIQKYHQQLLSGIERIKAHLSSPEMPPEKIAFLTKKQAELEGQLLLFRNKYIDSSVRPEVNTGEDLLSNKYFSPAPSQSMQPPPPSQSTPQSSSQAINQLPFSQQAQPIQLAHPMQQQGHPFQGTIPVPATQFSQGFSFPASSTSARQISPPSNMMAAQVSAGNSPLTTVSPQGPILLSPIAIQFFSCASASHPIAIHSWSCKPTTRISSPSQSCFWAISTGGTASSASSPGHEFITSSDAPTECKFISFFNECSIKNATTPRHSIILQFSPAFSTISSLFLSASSSAVFPDGSI
ncbi:hypothetical protein MDAP_002193 [Mitosporidium daphniae]